MGALCNVAPLGREFVQRFAAPIPFTSEAITGISLYTLALDLNRLKLKRILHNGL
jgi:hypothetical protein